MYINDFLDSRLNRAKNVIVTAVFCSAILGLTVIMPAWLAIYRGERQEIKINEKSFVVRPHETKSVTVRDDIELWGKEIYEDQNGDGILDRYIFFTGGKEHRVVTPVDPTYPTYQYRYERYYREGKSYYPANGIYVIRAGLDE